MERRNRDRVRQTAKKKLQDYSVSRCKTTLIGSIEKFELGFGFIWGHGQPYASLTDDQKEMREIWREVRYEILADGEHRINQLKDKFDLYEVENRTNYTFNLKRLRGEEDGQG